MPIILMQKDDGSWSPTQWRTLRRVKSWATRHKHAWEMNGDVLVVSTADGSVMRYLDGSVSKIPPPPACK